MRTADYTQLVPLVDEEQARAASEEELTITIGLLVGEQIRRALECADPVAVAEEAFERGFDFRGAPVAPYLHQQLLVCPGVKIEKSRTSHDCVFVAVAEGWAWESPEVVHDEMRQLPGPKTVRRAVTILPLYEGLTYDVVTSEARGGGRCQMKTVRSFEVRGGALVETKARTRAEGGHR